MQLLEATIELQEKVLPLLPFAVGFMAELQEEGQQVLDQQSLVGSVVRGE